MSPLLWKVGIGAALVLAVLLTLTGWGRAQYKAGDRAARAELGEEMAERQRVADRALDAANAKTVAAEASVTARLLALGAAYEKDIEDANAAHARDRAALLAGTDRLRVRVAVPACRGGGQLPAAPAAAGGRDDTATADLPPGIAVALADAADRADNVVRQLTACQAVVLGYRETINGNR